MKKRADIHATPTSQPLPPTGEGAGLGVRASLGREGRRTTDPKVLVADRLANGAIRVGGIAIVASVLGIFVFILATVLPLFSGAKAAPLPTPAPPQPAVAALSDERQEKILALLADGTWSCLDAAAGRWEAAKPLPGWPGGRVAAAWAGPRAGRVALADGDGRVWAAEVRFNTLYDGGARRVEPEFTGAHALRLPAAAGVPAALAYAKGAEAEVAAAVSRGGEPAGVMAGPAGRKPFTARLEPGEGRATCLALDEAGERLLVGTDQGAVVEFSVGPGACARLRSAQAFGPGEGVTALGWALGGQSLLAGGGRGSLASFCLVEQGDMRAWVRTHAFKPVPGPVTALAPSPRDKCFAAASAGGALRLCHLTSERVLLDLRTGVAPAFAALAPKADGLLCVDAAGRLARFAVRNPHPEVSLRTLFGKVWYEGYDAPDYVWQSSGGGDDFEPKFSLTPLVYGTLKGALFALLFAIPLAILAAVYTSQFMSPELKRWVKPAVELMAALPSVVLGFLAALVVAPFLEQQLFSCLLALALAPAFTLTALLGLRAAPQPLQRRLAGGGELATLAMALLLGMALVAAAGPALERFLFAGDFKAFLQAHGMRVDPRNSLVVGFAMGFAVIPIIYTICEDALSSVPRHLVSASLAAGATPWQTAWRVVVPVAASGIFSAVMVGFGRAVGETMIVLMATGNTPVMDASPFNGFRALSANIAVEIPEAPVGGTLYRVLFLAALLLFALTFAVNTAAEMVRLHLRKKYSQL